MHKIDKYKNFIQILFLFIFEHITVVKRVKHMRKVSIKGHGLTITSGQTKFKTRRSTRKSPKS